jgi:hypothetical protein
VVDGDGMKMDLNINVVCVGGEITKLVSVVTNKLRSNQQDFFYQSLKSVHKRGFFAQRLAQQLQIILTWDLMSAK